MNGFDFLNLVIGLIFIFLIYSIAASTIWEIIINFSNLRGRMMRKWILNNFKEFADWENKGKNKIIEHPMINGLFKNKSIKNPIYVSSEVFSEVLIDLIVTEDGTTDSATDINSLKDRVKESNLLDPRMKGVFLQYVSEASGNLQYVKDKIGKWYDEAQERLIGSYKRSLQFWIFIIAIILVGATNADTIKIANYLYNNPQARETIANKANLYVQDTTVLRNITKIDASQLDSVERLEQKEIIENIDHNLETLKELNEELSEAKIPIGWNAEEFNSLKSWGILEKIGGLLLTVFAVSLGSPFWFDILSKLANLRSEGNKPKSTQD